MDKVFIKGLEVEGIIGIFQWEREVKQVISIDIEMEFDNKLAAKSDSIEDALNYKKVGKRVTAFIQKSKFKLAVSAFMKMCENQKNQPPSGGKLHLRCLAINNSFGQLAARAPHVARSPMRLPIG